MPSITKKIKLATFATIASVTVVSHSTISSAYTLEDIEDLLQQKGFGSTCGSSAGNLPAELENMVKPARSIRALGEKMAELQKIVADLSSSAESSSQPIRPIDEYSNDRLELEILSDVDVDAPSHLAAAARQALQDWRAGDLTHLKQVEADFAPSVEARESELRAYRPTFFALCQEVRDAEQKKDRHLESLPGILCEPVDDVLMKAFDLVDNYNPSALLSPGGQPGNGDYTQGQYHLLQALNSTFTEDYAQALETGSVFRSQMAEVFPDLYASFEVLSEAYGRARDFFLEHAADDGLSPHPEDYCSVNTFSRYQVVAKTKPEEDSLSADGQVGEAPIYGSAYDVLTAVKKLIRDLETPVEDMLGDYKERLQTVRGRLVEIAEGSAEEEGLASYLGLEGALELDTTVA